MKLNISKIKARKKIWDQLGFHYKGIGYLNKNHSLNCYCAMCRSNTYFRRLENKRDRLKIKLEIKKEL
jgi:hypothetical protein